MADVRRELFQKIVAMRRGGRDAPKHLHGSYGHTAVERLDDQQAFSRRPEGSGR